MKLWKLYEDVQNVTPMSTSIIFRLFFPAHRNDTLWYFSDNRVVPAVVFYGATALTPTGTSQSEEDISAVQEAIVVHIQLLEILQDLTDQIDVAHGAAAAAGG